MPEKGLERLRRAAETRRAARLLRSGRLLRLHVVAQDDTTQMQALKLPVRDAVRAAYASGRRPGEASMLENARALLPRLTEAARQAARKAGFDRPVTVTLGPAVFDRRELEGTAVPAGVYPALIVRMGDARGHNWWGLLDPEASLQWAAVQPGSGPVTWDWSLEALLRALLRWIGG